MPTSAEGFSFRLAALLYGAGWCASLLLTLPLVPPPFAEDWLRRPLADDAYYHLVVARNLAAGEGATVGGQPTSGFQPAFVLACSVLGGLARWDRLGVPLAVTVFNWLLYSVAGTLLVRTLWLRLHPEHRGRLLSLLAPILWLISPAGQSVSLNGMETTLALLSWLVVAWGVAVIGLRPVGARAAATLGLAMGGAFLIRNDAVAMMAAYGGALVATSLDDPGPNPSRFGPALRSAGVTFGVILVCALPWILHVVATTGSLLPQGGRAERAGGLYDLGRPYQIAAVLEAADRNLSLVPLPFASLPPVLKGPAVVAMLLGFITVLGLLRRGAGGPMQDVLAFLAGSVACLGVVYGAFFGAGHMADRWMAPCILLGVLLAAEAMEQFRLWRPGLSRRTIPAVLALMVAGRIAWTVTQARRPSPTNTWGLLQFVRAHDLPRPLGAFQSGLLAWIEPDVVNLDGKTNREALDALSRGRFGTWLAEGPIRTVVDTNLLGVEHDPAVRAAFLLRRPEPGIAILERRIGVP